MKTNSVSFAGCLLVGFAVACVACAEPTGGDDEGTVESTSAALMKGGLGANGDSCTVRTKPDGTKVPGTEKDGECCATADPTDCVIILKPFPGVGSVFFLR
jgi:hypothetical protein